MNTQQFLFAAVHLLGMLVWKLMFFFVKGEVIDFTIETCTSKDNLMRGSLLPKKATILNGNDSKKKANFYGIWLYLT